MPSRYGPPVFVPDETGQILGNAISGAASTFVQRRRQKKLDQEAEAQRKFEQNRETESDARAKHESDVRDFMAGLRPGAPPTSIRHDTIPAADFTPPSSADLSAHLRGAPLPGQTQPAAVDAFSPPTGREFASMIANPGVTPTTRRSMPGGGATMSDGRDTAPTHPGAFDVATRQFGGSPLQLATAAAQTNGTAQPAAAPTTFNIPYTDPRYQPFDATHYLDTTQTPEARAQALRETDPAYRANLEHTQAETELLRGGGRKTLRTAMVNGQPADVTVNERGDVEVVPGVTPYSRPADAGKSPSEIPGTQEWKDAQDALARIRAKYRPKPNTSEPLVAVRHADGTTELVPRSEAAHKTPATGTGFGNVRGFGQGGVFGAGSGIGSVDEMKVVNPEMKATEKAMAEGAISIDGWDTFRQGLIAQLRDRGFIDEGIRTALIRDLASTNPDLVDYGTNTLAWVMGDMNLSRGGTDRRERIAEIVDGLSLPIGPMTQAQRTRYFQRMQERRDARLGGLEQGADAAKVMLQNATRMPGSPGGRGGGAGGGGAPQPVAAKPTDADFARAWAAIGSPTTTDADVATWLAAHPAGRRTP